jgi:FkbM family methyltransferase
MGEATRNNRLNEFLSDPDFRESALCRSFSQKPLGFVDVGARGGVHELVDPLAGVTAVLGFEPDAEECRRLAKQMGTGSVWKLFEVEPVALAASQGKAVLHLTAMPTNHSLLEPDPGFISRYRMRNFEAVGTASVKTASLDHVLFEQRPAQDFWGEFLKLDTQGTEHDILLGAERVLEERTVAVMSEVEFWPVYSGQKLFSDMEQLLRKRGFSFYGFFNVHSRSLRRLDKAKEAGRERLFRADAVFFKDPLAAWPRAQELPRRGYEALILCAACLGYFDFALELIANASWLAGGEAARLESFLRRRAARPAQKSAEEIRLLADRVRLRPESATLELGWFVDRFRDTCNYADTNPAVGVE